MLPLLLLSSIFYFHILNSNQAKRSIQMQISVIDRYSNEKIFKKASIRFLEKSPEEMPLPAYRPFRDGPFQMTMGIIS